MVMRRGSSGLVVLLFAAATGSGAVGCSVSFAEDSDDSGMVSDGRLCEMDEECGPDASCRDGTCVGDDTIFHTALVEIAVPNSPTAGAFAGVRYLRTLTALPSEGGRLDLELSAPTVVNLRVTPPPCADAEGEPVARESGICPEGSSSERSCRFDVLAAPLEVTLTPSEWAQGLSTLRYTTRSTCEGDPCTAWNLQVSVPPGQYDVYLRPDPAAEVPDETCSVVPEIFPLEVPADVQLVVDYGLSPASRLDLEVRWPLEGNDGAALVGWMVDMLDSASGRRLSTTVRLGTPDVTDGVATYPAAVDYVPTGVGNAGSELVRLQPPVGDVAPTIVVERSALELFRGPAVIDQLTTLPRPVQVEGQILARTSADDASQLQSVAGGVTLVATELESLPPGVLASYRQSVTVDAENDGVFAASLLPGKYRVRVVPPGDCSNIIPCSPDEILCECPLAATEVTDFVVAVQPDVQAGKTVELEWQTRVTGRVRSASDAAVSDAEVLAISIPQRPTALEVALGVEAFVPRASSGESDASGRFELFADGGSFNISVRPRAGTGLAWLVRPNVPVRSGSGSHDLEQLVLPLPVSYSGVVRVAGADADQYAILPNATIRAFVPISTASPHSNTVVQVAEALTDGDGKFQLLVPTTLEHDR